MLNTIYLDLIPCLSELCVWYWGLYSLNGRASYRQISRILEVEILDVIIIVPLWKITSSVVTEVLTKFRSDWKSLNLNLAASSFFVKTPGCLVSRGPGTTPVIHVHPETRSDSAHCPDSKVHGANVGPIWCRQDPGWPHEPCYLGIYSWCWHKVTLLIDANINMRMVLLRASARTSRVTRDF